MFNDLEAHQWAVSSSLFPLEFCTALGQECQMLSKTGQLNKAGIGQISSPSSLAEIRGDFTHWLTEDTSSALQRQMLTFLDEIQQLLNRSFYLALKRYEAHFAFYPPGAGYQKHVDNHRGRNARKITFILYLNQDWQSGHGGELSIYDPLEQDHLLNQIQPKIGTFVLFRSELFPHQVEKSLKNRFSLTGWFRDDLL